MPSERAADNGEIVSSTALAIIETPGVRKEVSAEASGSESDVSVGGRAEIRSRVRRTMKAGTTPYDDEQPNLGLESNFGQAWEVASSSEGYSLERVPRPGADGQPPSQQPQAMDV